MPFLDVTDITVDPDLADLMTVTRRAEVISLDTGRSSWNSTVIPDVPGVVTMEDPAQLMRRDDSDSSPRLIFVASPFEFRAVSKGFKPDQIEWPPLSGTLYTVIKVYPYSRYGRGMHEVVAESMNATDEAM